MYPIDVYDFWRFPNRKKHLILLRNKYINLESYIFSCGESKCHSHFKSEREKYVDLCLTLCFHVLLMSILRMLYSVPGQTTNSVTKSAHFSPFCSLRKIFNCLMILVKFYSQ